MRVRTLDELADLSGVSPATVSRVINGGPVSEATRTKVLDVLDRVEYRPNLAARSLASGRTGVVGLVMHVPAFQLFNDPYFSQLLVGITDTLSQEATGLMLWLGGRSKEETLDQILGSHFADGIIATATAVEDPLVDGLLASEMPTVLIGHRRHDDAASYVDVDNLAASEIVVEHLVSRGARRIGHITGERGTVSGEDRLIGYDRALARAGISERFVVDGDYTVEGGYAAARQLIGQVDAIYAASDVTAMGVYRAADEAGVTIPGDLLVAGFDDLDFTTTMTPPLTTVRQNVRAQGETAAQALLQLLADPEAVPRRVLLPTELVVRHSTTGGV